VRHVAAKAEVSTIIIHVYILKDLGQDHVLRAEAFRHGWGSEFSLSLVYRSSENISENAEERSIAADSPGTRLGNLLHPTSNPGFQ